MLYQWSGDTIVIIIENNGNNCIPLTSKIYLYKIYRYIYRYIYINIYI